MLLSGLHPFLRSRRRSHIPRDVLGVGCPQGAPSSRTLIALNARSSATFLFPVRICCNGHESAKLQLLMETIGDKSLDNGFLCTEWLALALGVLSSQWQNWSIPMSPISTPCQIGESRGKRHDVCGARGKQIPEFGGSLRRPDNGGKPSRGELPISAAVRFFVAMHGVVVRTESMTQDIHRKLDPCSRGCLRKREMPVLTDERSHPPGFSVED